MVRYVHDITTVHVYMNSTIIMNIGMFIFAFSTEAEG
jgi:hypothetical protein